MHSSHSLSAYLYDTICVFKLHKEIIQYTGQACKHNRQHSTLNQAARMLHGACIHAAWFHKPAAAPRGIVASQPKRCNRLSSLLLRFSRRCSCRRRLYSSRRTKNMLTGDWEPCTPPSCTQTKHSLTKAAPHGNSADKAMNSRTVMCTQAYTNHA